LRGEGKASPCHLAIACHGVGRSAEAIALLARAFEEHDPMMVFLNVEPKWASLPEEPRFLALLERMKLP